MTTLRPISRRLFAKQRRLSPMSLVAVTYCIAAIAAAFILAK